MGTERPPSILTRTRPRTREANLSTHVMYPAANPPPQAAAWDGWPVEWNVPHYDYIGTQSGMFSHDPDQYLSRVTTTMIAVDFNTRQLATFPIYSVRDDTGERRSLPSWAQNPEPIRYASWVEFSKDVWNSYQLHGEIIVVVTARYENGRPARFVALNPAHVDVTSDGMGGLEFRIGGPDGDMIPRADVLYLRFQSLPGHLRGIGPIQWVWRSILSAEALERYSSDIAHHGLWALLKHPSNLNAAQVDAAKNAWQANRRRDPSAPAALVNGWEFEALNLSPKDMALLDIRTFDEQRIASAFGVPPILIGLPQPGGSLTYQSISSLTDHHWRTTLRTWAEDFAQALSLWALPHLTSIRYNRDEYVRPGFGERAQAYSTLHGIREPDGDPAMTVQEIRRAEDLPPFEHRHVEYLNTNPPGLADAPPATDHDTEETTDA